MGDVHELSDPRSQALQAIYDRMRDPEFRAHLSVRDVHGERPVTVALRSDRISSVISRIERCGGASNVLVPFMNSIFIIAMGRSDRVPDGAAPAAPPVLDPDCTMGVFLSRAIGDDSTDETFWFSLPEVPLDGGADVGSAQLVAIS